MAEKKYIEREVAVNILRDEAGRGVTAYHIGLYAAARAVDSIPAADVRPVVRGKWSVQEIYKHEMSYGTTAYEPVYKCSACGNLMESYLRYDEPIMPEDADFPRFCPNCGADMREES